MAKLSRLSTLGISGGVKSFSAKEQGDLTINVSRTSGLAPLSVYFDTDITVPGITHPFHELYYKWTFDDSSAGTWTRSGVDKNTAIGPSASHVFDDAGTYTVTCTAYQYNDAGALVASWVQTTGITVTDTWAETYVFSNSGDFTGAPSADDQITTSNWVTVSDYAATNRRLLLKRGDTYSCSATGSLSADGPGLVGAWGTGADPILQPTADSVDITRITRHDDWRVMDLHFYGNGYGGTEATRVRGYVNTGLTYGSDQVLVYNCEFERLDTAVSTYDPYIVDMAVVGCTSTTPLDSQYYIAGGRGVFMGNDNADQGYNSNGHCFRLYGGGPTHGAVIQHNRLWDNVSQHHAIKVHAADDAGHNATQSRVVISDNDTSQANIWAIDLGPQSAGHDEHVWDVIVERNHCGGDRAIACEGATNVTIRNNIVDVSGDTYHSPIYIESRERSGVESHDLENVWVYNNTGYNVDASSDFVFCTIYDYSDCVVVNNLASSPNDSSPEMLDDNGTNTTANNNLLTDTPGWESATPSAATDFKLDPNDVNKLAIDTGTRTHWCPGTYGGGNRVTGPGNLGSSYDLGAWEIGAEAGDGGTVWQQGLHDIAGDGMRIPSETTDQYIYFVAVDPSDLSTRETGFASADFHVYRSRNGAAAALMTHTINEVDSTHLPGVYELLLNEDMTIDAGNDSEEMVFHIEHDTGLMAPVTRTIELYRPKYTAGSTLTASAINSEVSDVLKTDLISELGAVPSATPTFEDAVMFLYMALRNRQTSTATALTVQDSSEVTIGSAVLSDDSTTFTKAEFATP